jgi:hypothetical protein
MLTKQTTMFSKILHPFNPDIQLIDWTGDPMSGRGEKNYYCLSPVFFFFQS